MPRKNTNRITKKEIGAALKSIYSNETGDRLDMRVHRAERPGKKKILIGLIVFFGLIAFVSWMGIFVFSKFGGSAADNLKLSIVGEEKPVAGKEIEYEVRYKNNDDFPLAAAELGLFLPKSFIMSGSEPVLASKNTFKIGTLEIGGEGVLKFKGKFFSTDGTKEVLQAVLTYKPANFNSNFQKVSNMEVVISGSTFDGSLEGPDKLSAGDTATYNLSYQNKSEEAFDRVAIDAILPQDFMISTTTPTIGKNNRWEIGKLEGGKEGELEIKGSFASGAKGQQDVVLRLGIIDESGGFLPLIEKKIATEVVGSDMVTTFMINSTDNFTAAKWGETLNYSITYKNGGNKTLYNVKFSTAIIGTPNEQGKPIIDWQSLKDANHGKVSGNEITWSKNEIAGLSQVKPGQEGTIDFSVKIINKPVNPSYKDYKIDSILSSEIERVGDVVVKRQLQSNKITAFLVSDAEFTSQARYYDSNNNLVGSGPVPPKVGQKTTYKIYWKLTNSMHELDDIKISADLSEGVVFSNSNADAGSLALDSSLKKIIWSLNLLPNSANTISGQFDLSITPLESDVGKALDLLANIEFTAKDKSTGGTITINAGNETTALADDPYVTSGGKVQN
ncbi:MAG: hypothetical protein WC459_00135 [Patescibacteria group bacterium]